MIGVSQDIDGFGGGASVPQRESEGARQNDKKNRHGRGTVRDRTYVKTAGKGL